MSGIYADGSIDVRVEAHIIPEGDQGYHTVRFDVQVYALGGNSDQNIYGYRMFHDPAYALMTKIAGVPWRDANRTLQWAYTDALIAHSKESVSSDTQSTSGEPS
jgi:hypothetical protein